MTDFELLRSYASSGSENEFAALVDRYANLVYSAALRQTSNVHDAEEISQSVFMVLAQKAATLDEHTIFPGWLLRTTRLVALKALRKEAHRRRTESEAMSVYLTETETDSAWTQIAPVLDEALFSLGKKDRDAVALRFFDQKSFTEIGNILGISDDNAQKRVSRALAKLRAFCVKRGMVVRSAVFAAAMTTSAVQAAPANLAASVIDAVTSGAPGPASIAKGVLSALERVRLRSLGLRGLTAALALMLALLTLHLVRLPRPTRLVAGPITARPEAFSPQAPSTLATVQASSSGQLRLRVIDFETGTPLAKARVTSKGVIPNSPISESVTDPLGESVVSYDLKASDDWILVIEIIRDGYIPKFVGWNAGRGDLIVDMPAEYTIRLARGEVIGGMVLNEGGEAISDAKVSIGGPGPELVGDGPPEREGLAIPHTEVTDVRGRWLCNHVPPELEVINCTVAHPDYIGVKVGVAKFQDTHNPSILRVSEPELRKQTAVVILKRGLVVTGVVVDEAGKPIMGARVTRDPARYGSASEMTGPDGTFRFVNAIEGKTTLTVQADGFVAKDVKLRPMASMDAVRFELARGGVLRGQVLDENDKPVSNATILAVGGDFDSGRFDWNNRTDESGKFEWHSVPPSHKLYTIHADGFASLTHLELAADGAEHRVALHASTKIPRLRICGTAINAETRQQIDSFEVWVLKSTLYFGSRLATGPELRTIGRSGRFCFLAPRSYNLGEESYSVEVRAEGCLPATLTVPAHLTNGPVLNYAVTLRSGLRGVVQSPDGQPATGAVVLLCAHPDDNVRLILPGQFGLGDFRGQRAETDTNGAFSIGMARPGGTALIAHDSGYAEIPLAQIGASQVQKLEPWGWVAGTLTIGGQSGSNETVVLSRTPPFLLAYLSTITDTDGHFSIGRLPPGQWRISHELKRNGRQIRPPLTQTTSIRVTTGKLTKVRLGGVGRKVMGRIGIEQLNQFDWKSCFVSLDTEIPGTPILSAHQSATDAVSVTAASTGSGPKFELNGAAYEEAAARDSLHYESVLEPDGSFTINDVIPGAYRLKIETAGARKIELRFLMAPRDNSTWSVVVPKASGTNAAPYELDLLEGKFNKR